jgi:hypothetical protein
LQDGLRGTAVGPLPRPLKGTNIHCIVGGV